MNVIAEQHAGWYTTDTRFTLADCDDTRTFFCAGCICFVEVGWVTPSWQSSKVNDSEIKPFYGRRTAELAKAHHNTLFLDLFRFLYNIIHICFIFQCMLLVRPWPCECYFNVTIYRAPLGAAVSLFWTSSVYSVGRDNSVGIATGYGLDGPGVRCWLWQDSPHPRSALGPTQLPTHWVSRISPGGKAVGAWCWPPNPIWRRD
jgi:hypothetical protein